MNCPVCGKKMVEEDFGGTKVDVCKHGCQGLWFDLLELTMLDEQYEGSGQSLERALKHPRVTGKARGPINCPKCNIPMQVHGYRRVEDVMVDECYKCGGIFLDAGKLKAIRDSLERMETQKMVKGERLEQSEAYQEAVETLEETPHKTPSLFFKVLSYPVIPTLAKYYRLFVVPTVLIFVIAVFTYYRTDDKMKLSPDDFNGGPVVEGRVIETKDATRETLHHWLLIASWSDPQGNTHEGVVKIEFEEYDILQPNDKVILMLKPDDPSVAMIANYHPEYIKAQEAPFMADEAFLDEASASFQEFRDISDGFKSELHWVEDETKRQYIENKIKWLDGDLYRLEKTISHALERQTRKDVIEKKIVNIKSRIRDLEIEFKLQKILREGRRKS